MGGTPWNGQQRVTNALGQFTDAPVGVTLPAPFSYRNTQELRAVSPAGTIIALGTNKISVYTNGQGHGKITIDNKLMNIHLARSR